jgi:hypothetical protein
MTSILTFLLMSASPTERRKESVKVRVKKTKSLLIPSPHQERARVRSERFR